MPITSSAPGLRFAAIGLDHRHIYDQVKSLLEIGAECVGFWTAEDVLPLQGFMERFPHIPRVMDRRRLLEDESIQLITCAALPRDRAGHAIEAMRHGKDFMVDKPGLTTFEQLDAVRRVQAETGRIFSVDFTERFEVRATTRAGQLVAAGAIGRVIHTAGLGPRRLNRPLRPDWFFRRDAHGGIPVDIASHKFDQFLFFTGSTDAWIVAARVANMAHPGDPEFEDPGEVMLPRSQDSGYFRVDWFTPDGLPTWGDGRLTMPRHRGLYRIAQIHRRRRPTGYRPSAPCRREGQAAHRLLRLRSTLLPQPARRHLRPHGDRDAAGPLLQGLRTGVAGPGRRIPGERGFAPGALTGAFLRWTARTALSISARSR
jgi:predicted dehydrogenase